MNEAELKRVMFPMSAAWRAKGVFDSVFAMLLSPLRLLDATTKVVADKLQYEVFYKDAPKRG